MKEQDYRFWVDRIGYSNKLFDIIRIDHFRAFDTYWKIPADCPTAIDGEWIEAPGYEVIDTLQKEIPGLDLVAEDLGLLRPEVLMLKDHYHLKGMKIRVQQSPASIKMAKASRRSHTVLSCRLHQFKELMGRGTAQLTVMLENDQFPDGHLAPRGGVVVFKHIQNGSPQQVKILLRKAGGLAGQIGGDVTLRPIQAVGHDVLASHFGVLILRIRFLGDGHAGDGDLLGHDRVNAAGKAQLYRPAYLAAVQRTLDKSSHNGTKGTDVKKGFTHSAPRAH